MKKLILAITLLTSINVMAQKDFDYTIYTNNCSYNGMGKGGGEVVRLTLMRKIQKEANVLKIISLVNTGDTETFIIKYVGWDDRNKSLLYITEDGKTIYAKPVSGEIKIENSTTNIATIYY